MTDTGPSLDWDCYGTAELDTVLSREGMLRFTVTRIVRPDADPATPAPDLDEVRAALAHVAASLSPPAATGG